MPQKKPCIKQYFNLDNPYLSMTFRFLTAALMLVGVLSTALMNDFMSSAAILYFTIQSNITIGVICFVFLIFDIASLAQKKAIIPPQWLYALKFLFTVAITLTFLVYWFMLMPQMVKTTPSYLYSASNITCHTLVPIFAILDFLLCDRAYKPKKFEFLLGTSMPLYYLAFAMICSYSGVTFDGNGAKVPYFFLDYEANTWFAIGGGKIGVFWWIWIVVALVIGISLALIYGQKAVMKKLHPAAE